jgi:hypothetical protein
MPRFKTAITITITITFTIAIVFGLDPTDLGCRAEDLSLPFLPHWLAVAAACVQ